jgi:hypothetical protein
MRLSVAGDTEHAVSNAVGINSVLPVIAVNLRLELDPIATSHKDKIVTRERCVTQLAKVVDNEDDQNSPVDSSFIGLANWFRDEIRIGWKRILFLGRSKRLVKIRCKITVAPTKQQKALHVDEQAG